MIFMKTCSRLRLVCCSGTSWDGLGDPLAQAPAWHAVVFELLFPSVLQGHALTLTRLFSPLFLSEQKNIRKPNTMVAQPPLSPAMCLYYDALLSHIRRSCMYTATEKRRVVVVQPTSNTVIVRRNGKSNNVFFMYLYTFKA